MRPHCRQNEGEPPFQTEGGQKPYKDTVVGPPCQKQEKGGKTDNQNTKVFPSILRFYLKKEQKMLFPLKDGCSKRWICQNIISCFLSFNFILCHFYLSFIHTLSISFSLPLSFSLSLVISFLSFFLSLSLSLFLVISFLSLPLKPFCSSLSP